jgi:hypothetical protein
MRRAQAVLLILALLAVPLAAIAYVDSCVQIACPCCADMDHSKAPHCRSALSGNCCMSGRGEAPPLPDFLLAAHQARLSARPFARLAAPSFTRSAVSDSVLSASAGFRSAPFEPPRS